MNMTAELLPLPELPPGLGGWLTSYQKAMGQNLRTAHFGGMPLWARNAFTEGCMGVELIRRPAWTEKEKP